MLNERLQILLHRDQRRRLEDEARRRGVSIASLIREAIDARFGGTRQEERRAALEHIRSLRGRFLTPAEINRLVEEEREEEYPELFPKR